MAATQGDPIDVCLERWHRHLRGDLPGGLDAVLREDCVFLSPIVYTPQEGREITKIYLQAAASTLAAADPGRPGREMQPGEGSSFRYVREVASGHDAVLEFETTVDGTYVNGVDMLTCDDDGMITQFEVMLRPLRAIELIHARMRSMLEQMAASDAPEGGA